MRRATLRCGALRTGALLAVFLAAGCSRSNPTPFSTDRAREHVNVLAGAIGSRPAGSEANDRAREYVVEQLRSLGFDVRVQAADARRPEAGLTVRVQNIIAIREGADRDAIALVSHYDSSPFAPGAADDGLGVAVSLEAARVLLQGPMRHTLAVLVTDAEEMGLMGAAAIAADPVSKRLASYVNLESVGSSGPSLLFETGPGNSWIVESWATHVSAPRGGSLATEVYRRIPNDTDFSILKRLGVPGLNFAPIGDGYAYHTPRDTADRLSPDTISHTGHTVVQLAAALDRIDLSRRTIQQAAYFDLLGWRAFSFGPVLAAALTVAALLFGVLAWVRCLRTAISTIGGGRFALTVLWMLVGVVAVFASMTAAAWLLREAREAYHPWYARPDRLFAFTTALAVLAGWSLARLGVLLPHGARGTRHPVLAWAVALPVWILLAALFGYFAPAAAYLFALPLLVAGVLLFFAPLSRTVPVRLLSVVSLAFNGALWGWILVHLLRFEVAHFGRIGSITPPWAYAAPMFVGAVVLAPPALAALTGRPLRRPRWTTALLLVAVVVTGAYAYRAPAYTNEQPLRRAVMFAQDSTLPAAYWQVGSSEAGLDFPITTIPFSASGGPLRTSVPMPRLPHAFVFAAEVPAVAEVPARVTSSRTRTGDSIEIRISVVPTERALSAAFVFPEGLVPSRPNLPGIVRSRRWIASYGAIPAEGAAFRAFVHASDDARLDDVRVIVRSTRLPGGSGWQGLVDWLPQDRTVWTSDARYIVQPLPELVPPPAIGTR